MMPEMDGLELVTQIRRLHPGLPVVLLTAHGSEEVAVKALRSGAASYVPKKNLDRDLYRTLENVLAHCRTAKSDDQISACLTATQSEFVLGNEADWIGPLVGRLQRELLRLQLFDDSTQMRIGMAVREALANGVEHGNLEAGSELRNWTMRLIGGCLPIAAPRSPIAIGDCTWPRSNRAGESPIASATKGRDSIARPCPIRPIPRIWKR